MHRARGTETKAEQIGPHGTGRTPGESELQKARVLLAQDLRIRAHWVLGKIGPAAETQSSRPRSVKDHRKMNSDSRHSQGETYSNTKQDDGAAQHCWARGVAGTSSRGSAQHPGVCREYTGGGSAG